jgi:hypothetical protein
MKSNNWNNGYWFYGYFYNANEDCWYIPDDAEKWRNGYFDDLSYYNKDASDTLWKICR